MKISVDNVTVKLMTAPSHPSHILDSSHTSMLLCLAMLVFIDNLHKVSDTKCLKQTEEFNESRNNNTFIAEQLIAYVYI